MSKVVKKQSDRIHFNITQWKLPVPPIAYVCVNPTRWTGDSMITCCVSKTLFTPPITPYLLSKTLDKIRLFLQETVPVFTGAVSSRLQVYCTQCGLFLLSHVAMGKILGMQSPIKRDNYSINGN